MCILSLCAVSFLALPNTVLLIESYHSEFEWDESYIKGLEKTLGSAGELHTFQMNTKRISAERYEESARNALQAYQDLKPSVVVLGDDNAFNFMYPKLFNEPISIVFLGINSNPRHLLQEYQGKASVTGVLEQPLFVKTMGDIGELIQGQDKKVRVMFDSGVTSKLAIDYMEKQTAAISRSLKIDIELQAISTEMEWHESVLGAKEDGVSAIVIGLYHTLINEKKQSVSADTILSWTNKNSTVPLFGFWDFSIGKGKAAGGVVLFGQLQGEQAGVLIMRILNGEQADSIPIQIGKKGRAIYSPIEMERWGLTPLSHWEPM
ncbi:hypothetical protein KP803_10240 [Vibrio sp. ZSDE26]|uniref:Sugar ABC transporter ATPase n=1 Tax=Vibrio amylolyticus TaxID=2847292 RepID=A0A9X1XJM7_9VIBR|nr:hypothetical protein [Vibrio amylolyticus]